MVRSMVERVQYWTEGVAPNRKFVVNYDDVREFGDNKFATYQAIFYETTGIL
jgi:trimeric autotransporter adhesin